MRFWIPAGVLLTFVTQLTAQPPVKPGEKPAEPSLKQKIESADIVIVGKVTQTGLSVASSFDVGVIEVREVLKGDTKVKSVHFKFVSSGGGRVAPYGKVGVDGVWVLSKKGGYMEARDVLSYLPVGDVKSVKDIIAGLGR